MEQYLQGDEWERIFHEHGLIVLKFDYGMDHLGWGKKRGGVLQF